MDTVGLKELSKEICKRRMRRCKHHERLQRCVNYMWETVLNILERAVCRLCTHHVMKTQVRHCIVRKLIFTTRQARHVSGFYCIETLVSQRDRPSRTRSVQQTKHSTSKKTPVVSCKTFKKHLRVCHPCLQIALRGCYTTMFRGDGSCYFSAFFFNAQFRKKNMLPKQRNMHFFRTGVRCF